jgi:hypothetical protein
LRAFSLDLHVLGTPPAFVLSQDQTLQLRIRFPSAFLAHAPATGARATVHSKHCGVRNTFVDLLSSFQRPTDTFLLRASDFDALPPFDRRNGRATYRAPQTPSRADESASRWPLRLQGSRCLAERSGAVKKAASIPLAGRLRQGPPGAGGCQRRTPRASAARLMARASPPAPSRTTPCTSAGTPRIHHP